MKRKPLIARITRILIVLILENKTSLDESH